MNSNLLEALADYLASDPVISTIFEGIYTSDAAPGTDLPYLVITKAGSEPTGVVGRGLWIDKVTINFDIRDTQQILAEGELEQVRTALMRPQVPLGWAGGRECGRWLAGDETGQVDAAMGPNGTDVWLSKLPIGFTITRSA